MMIRQYHHPNHRHQGNSNVLLQRMIRVPSSTKSDRNLPNRLKKNFQNSWNLCLPLLSSPPTTKTPSKDQYHPQWTKPRLNPTTETPVCTSQMTKIYHHNRGPHLLRSATSTSDQETHPSLQSTLLQHRRLRLGNAQIQSHV